MPPLVGKCWKASAQVSSQTGTSNDSSNSTPKARPAPEDVTPILRNEDLDPVIIPLRANRLVCRTGVR
jgi:hypothetical protein